MLRNGVFYAEILLFIRPRKKYGFADYLSCYVSLNQCSESVVIMWSPPGVDRCVMSCLSAVSSVFSLADRSLERAFLDSGKLDLGLVSASSDGIEP